MGNNYDLQTGLEEIERLEKETGVLGVQTYSEGNPSTEESAGAVITLLETVQAIQQGKRKFTCPNFSKLGVL